jgi:hypothetical protein
MTKKVEVLIIEDNMVVHHTSSNVYEDANPFNIAVTAIINDLTSGKVDAKQVRPAIQQPKPVLPVTDKPVSLADMQKLINQDFTPTKAEKKAEFNIQTIPPIKMNEVLQGVK